MSELWQAGFPSSCFSGEVTHDVSHHLSHHFCLWVLVWAHKPLFFLARKFCFEWFPFCSVMEPNISVSESLYSFSMSIRIFFSIILFGLIVGQSTFLSIFQSAPYSTMNWRARVLIRRHRLFYRLRMVFLVVMNFPIPFIISEQSSLGGKLPSLN